MAEMQVDLHLDLDFDLDRDPPPVTTLRVPLSVADRYRLPAWFRLPSDSARAGLHFFRFATF